MSDQAPQPPVTDAPGATGGDVEGDETTVVDHSLGRLFALSDGVFAIAMTLLALDLKVPDLDHPSDAALRHALAQNSSTYLSYGLSFYVVVSYWLRHRRILSSVTAATPGLIRDTMLLLFLVATIPFPTSLLAQYGSAPFALALYAGINALANLTMMSLRRDVRPGLSAAAAQRNHVDGIETWGNLTAFLICIPAAYILHGHGPWALLLLALPGRLRQIRLLLRRRSSR